MGVKGDKTKQLICSEAYKLFAKKGFKTVTMKDICESTGLSRGGLYRHFESTEQIFMEIISEFTNRQQNEFREKINENISAVSILNNILTKYEEEMLNSEDSLSIAICEFFSSENISRDKNLIECQYLFSKQMWVELIEYGISKDEFKKVDAEAVFDLIVFSYQGVRLYGRLMNIDTETPGRIIKEIKWLLLKKEEL